MKLLLNLLLGSTILLSFSQCGNSKGISSQLEKNLPFTIENATYNDWVAGVKGGGSGTNVIIEIKNIENLSIEIDSMYFREQKVKAELKNNSYIGRFVTPSQRQDLILHKDPKEEFGNHAPSIKDIIPFDLENDETVISYKEKGKWLYSKVKLTKGETVHHP